MIHNAFDTLFLDTKHLGDLEIIANKENLLIDDSYGSVFLPAVSSRLPSNCGELLFLIMMYEHLDSSISNFSWPAFIEEGIIDEKESCIINGYGGGPIDKVDNEFECVNQAKEIALFYKDDLIRTICKRVKKITGCTVKDLIIYRDDRKLSLNRNFEEVFDALVDGDFEADLSQFGHHYNPFSGYDEPNVDFNDIDPTDFFYNLIDSIYLSKIADVSYLSSIFRTSKKQKTIDDVGKIYLTQINYISDMQIIPVPESLADVFRFRQDENLKSFRNVMNQWVNYVEHGEFTLAQRMKTDLIKANNALEHLGKYKRVSNHIVTRTFKLAGNFIPGLSAVLALGDYIEPLVVSAIEEKYKWSLMVKDSNSHKKLP